MDDGKRTGVVQDYTTAFLVSALVLCMIVLVAIWAIWGFFAALFVSWTADRAIVIESRRARRH